MPACRNDDSRKAAPFSTRLTTRFERLSSGCRKSIKALGVSPLSYVRPCRNDHPSGVATSCDTDGDHKAL